MTEGFWTKLFRRRTKEVVTTAAPVRVKPKNYHTLKAHTDERKAASRASHVGESLKRIPPDKLERMYGRDPILFNGCNTLSYLVNRGWTVSGKDEALADAFEAWLKDSKIDDKIRQMALQLCIYGNVWVEHVLNKNKNRLVDIRLLDPKTMDYERETTEFAPNGTGRIIVDESGVPTGFVQRLSSNLALALTNKDIHFTRDEITHVTLRLIADSFIGVGVIEPCYKQTVIKMNIEEALGEAVFHIGFPTYVLKVGDKESMADVPDELIDAYSKELANASSKTDFTMPWYANLSILSSPEVRDMKDNLSHYIDSQIASVGVPKPFITESAEGANRASLEFLTEIGDRNVHAIQKAIETGMREIATKWTMMQGKDKSLTPEFRFSSLSRWDSKTHLDLVYRGVEMGVIVNTPELRKHVAGILKVPFDPEASAVAVPAPPARVEDDDDTPIRTPGEPEMSLAKKIVRKYLEASEGGN